MMRAPKTARWMAPVLLMLALGTAALASCSDVTAPRIPKPTEPEPNDSTPPSTSLVR